VSCIPIRLLKLFYAQNSTNKKSYSIYTITEVSEGDFSETKFLDISSMFSGLWLVRIKKCFSNATPQKNLP
jgi:hypothetical protein